MSSKQERIQKTKPAPRRQEAESHESQPSTKAADLKHDLDDVMDEIDTILSSEEVVDAMKYHQLGGE